ncbi:MAG: DEAD/DEAH box helicase [Planctomycetales bacterium]|nr:DEAD/DEAH box helicase [Planctomycetales bacterium]
MAIETCEMDFSQFELSDPVRQAVDNSAYTKPTLIQEKTIPLILNGSDLIGQAETGTGKTAAFALPLLSMLQPKLRETQVLVLAPTRELAIQVAASFEKYGSAMQKLRVATIYGGQSYEGQNRALRNGAQVVVGTPGRVMDHMRRGTLKLDALKAFVLDEADEMLRMGFAEDVRWILSEAPKERQTLLFSATLPPNVREIADEHLSEPEHIVVKSKTLTAATIHQRVCMVGFRDKLDVLVRILESEPTEGVLIFAKTREMTTRLAEQLCQHGFTATSLNGDMQQKQREKTIEQLKSGRSNIVVATDVAARGLDVQRISHVINYDFPHDTEAYIHRIGRTGRAGREGNAILFIGRKDKFRLRRLEQATRQQITWMEQPSEKEVHEQRVAQFKESLCESIEAGGYECLQDLLHDFQKETCVPIERIAAALLKMSHPNLVPAKETKSRRSRRDQNKHGFGDGSISDDFNEDAFRGDDDKSRKRNGRRGEDQDMQKYRIEVGHVHGVRPGNIVGAIANEVGLAGNEIGGIQISTHFSSVDLPRGLPSDVIRRLQKVRVAGQMLRISAWDKGSQRRGTDFRRRGPKKSSHGKRPKNRSAK